MAVGAGVGAFGNCTHCGGRLAGVATVVGQHPNEKSSWSASTSTSQSLDDGSVRQV